MGTGNRKVLYIDLNHWINLAKARKKGDLALEQRLETLVDSGKIVIPISAVHILEACSIFKDQQRQDLASMLRGLSRGFVLRDLESVRYIEMQSRIGNHYGIRMPQDIRPFVLAKGYLRALGEPEIDFSPWSEVDPIKSVEAEREFWGILDDEQSLDLILSEYVPKLAKESPEAKLIRFGHNNTRLAAKGKDLNEAEKDCVLEFAKEFAKLAAKVANDFKLSNELLNSNPPKHFWSKEYMASVPTVNVWSKLSLYLSRCITRDITINDLYDMGHFAVALPYCDIVVADSAMAHLLTFRKLNDSYGTVVYSSLEMCIDNL
ncbi:MAG: hypothetical protein JRF30_10540 [Deltaproteobacteria bacterium]|nr:hypothetical protein [Deltaproteobacteria bacterium]MBW2331333.1 hypothetical protein [Deltaproteobacteria bacterium]